MSQNHKHRRDLLFDELSDEIGAAILAPSRTLTYFSGLKMHQSKRPTLIVLFRDDDPAVVLPELESNRVRDALGDEAIFYMYADGPEPVDAARSAFNRLVSDRELPARVAAEFRSTRLLENDAPRRASSTALTIL